MCKNKDNPCPGCSRHARAADPRLMFLTPEEAAAPRAVEPARPSRQEAHA